MSDFSNESVLTSGPKKLFHYTAALLLLCCKLWVLKAVVTCICPSSLLCNIILKAPEKAGVGISEGLPKLHAPLLLKLFH